MDKDIRQLDFFKKKEALNNLSEELKKQVNELVEKFETQTKSKALISNYTVNRTLEMMVLIDHKDFMDLNAKDL